MVQDNFSSQLDDKSQQTKGQSTSIHFDDKPENLPVLDWQKKKRKYRRATLDKEDCDNITAGQIDTGEKLLIEMEKDSDGVLTMILDMRNIYTKYLNQANHADK